MIDRRLCVSSSSARSKNLLNERVTSCSQPDERGNETRKLIHVRPGILPCKYHIRLRIGERLPALKSSPGLIVQHVIAIESREIKTERERERETSLWSRLRKVVRLVA